MNHEFMKGSRADFFGNYPAGAASDPYAPYNRTDPEEREFGVMVTYELSRTCDVTTTEYDGTEMLRPMEDYEESFLKPTDIFLFARRAAETLLSDHDRRLGSRRSLERIIDSCEGWEIADRQIERC